MDWKEHDNFNNIWLVSFAGSGVLFALTGLALLIMRFDQDKKAPSDDLIHFKAGVALCVIDTE
jgi:hypothetical protein